MKFVAKKINKAGLLQIVQQELRAKKTKGTVMPCQGWGGAGHRKTKIKI